MVLLSEGTLKNKLKLLVLALSKSVGRVDKDKEGDKNGDFKNVDAAALSWVAVLSKAFIL